MTPQEFTRYRDWALDLGFLECVSGPLVRSSYRAEQRARAQQRGTTAVSGPSAAGARRARRRHERMRR